MPWRRRGGPKFAARGGGRWRAHWIWSRGEQAPENFYLYCRKAFRLTTAAVAASVDVSADSRYKLHVNGVLIGRGPARADQRWQYYDSYEVAAHLRPGENVISAIVHHYGVPTGSSTLGRGGFLLQGEARQADGATAALDTDKSWRVLPSPTWVRETSRVTPALMWMEIYDARLEPLGWQRPGYDDSGWQRPVVLGAPPVRPWENLIPRDIPFLLEEERFPTRVVDQGIVEPAPPAARVDLGREFGRTTGDVAYLFAYLESPVTQRVRLCVQGSGSPLSRKVWVEGVAYAPAPPEVDSPARALIEFPLRQGWNELLLKVGRDHPRWTLDVMLGPAAGQSYQPVVWRAEPRVDAPRDRAWLAGPYGRPGAAAFDLAHDIEHLVLGRAPGAPLRLPARRAKLDFGPGRNVAVVMAMESRRSQPAALPGAAGLLRKGGTPAVISTATAGGDVYLTLDFGKTVTGYVRLRMNGETGGIVDLGYSEKLEAGHVNTLRGEFPWNFADRYIMREGQQKWELFFWKGFRYLQLTFRSLTRPVEVDSVSLVFTSYPVRWRGAFESSDALLNRTWEVGRWTLQVNMHDAYEDTPWREQSQWVGDAQIALLANYMTFGDTALATKYLRQIAQGQSGDGALPPTYPGGVRVYPIRQAWPSRSTIPTFMAQWVSTLWDHYRYTACRELVKELYPHLVRLMAYFDRFLDTHGLLADVPGFVFLDWVPGQLGSRREPGGELTGLNSHYYRALLDAARMAELLGDETRQREWLGKARTVNEAVNARLWSETRGVYLHGRVNDEPMRELMVQDSVLAAYAGLAPPDRTSRSFATLSAGATRDLVEIRTPYFYFFYLQALRRGGRHGEALATIRRVYGGMLRAGATTWWEHVGGYASLSHAWSCAPNFDLSTYLLGVEPTAPGFAEFRVAPQPSDVRWARGRVPTVRGDVAVEWRLDRTHFGLTVEAPMDAWVELSVPALGPDAARLMGSAEPPVSDFSDGRASYRVMGPGVFHVDSRVALSGPA